MADTPAANTVTEDSKPATQPIQQGTLTPQAKYYPDEEPDIPLSHWAYKAMNKLGEAGLLEINKDSVVRDYRSVTRYEFVVDLARLLWKAGLVQGASAPPNPTKNVLCNLPETPISQPPDLVYGQKDVANALTRREYIDAFTALLMEFGDDLTRLGVRGVNLDICENNGLVHKKPMDK